MKRLIVTGISSLIFSWGGAAFATNVDDFKVNDDFGTTYQGYSTIATDLNGNFVVCWYDLRNGNNDIYYQLFDRSGTRQGANLRANDDTGIQDQLRPSLMKDQSGRFVIAWQDFRINGYPFNGDIYAQRYAVDGTLQSTNFKINDDFGTETQGWQDMGADDYGNYVVTWEDNRNGNYDIYAQRFDKNGNKLGTNFRVNDDAGTSYQHNPKIGVDGTGDFIITWYDNRSGKDNILAQRYNSSGVAQGANFLVNDVIGTEKHVSPDVACDYNGNFTIVWQDYRNGNYPTNPDIYGRMFWADGTSRSGNFRVNNDGNTSNQFEAEIGMDYFGNFIVVWRDDRDGNNDIYAQYYNNNGTGVGPNYRVNSDVGKATQSFPNVTMDGINIYYTWSDDRNGSFDVYAKITEYGKPTMVVTPTSMQFTSQLGAGNPPSQDLLINNLGYGILNWKITSNQVWLHAGSMTGTAPSTVPISVTTAGLAYGTYSGRITVADASGKDSSRTMVVTLNITAPQIQVVPPTVSIDAHLGAPPPTDKSITINNIGAGTLNWTLSGVPKWLQFSHLTGTAPSTSDIQIVTDSLPGPGIYSATVQISATGAINSPQSAVINLNYIADGPVIGADPDTINLSFTSSATTITGKPLSIHNIGAGVLHWSISADAGWVTFSNNTGTGDAIVTVGAQAGILPVGEYYGTYTITDPLAYNNPKIGTVHASVILGPPSICGVPDTITFLTRENISYSDTQNVFVQNCGTPGLNWTISSPQGWLTFLPTSGTENQSTNIMFNTTGMAAGIVGGSAIITSPTASNSPDTIKVVADVAPSDTIAISSTNVLAGHPFVLDLRMHNFLPIDSIGLILNFDNTQLVLDSIAVAARMVGVSSFQIISQQATGNFQVKIGSIKNGAELSRGDGSIATLYFHALQLEGIENITCDATLLDSLGFRLNLAQTAGTVSVSAATPVYPIGEGNLPTEFKLYQNFPNPFNLATAIYYSLDRAGTIDIEIFNILGRSVKTLYAGYQIQGNHQVGWDATDENGSTLSSGLYFIRLKSTEHISIIKAVLLK